jgi:hypothetical protein
MAHVMPSQVIEAIDDLFPHARLGHTTTLGPGTAPQLLCVLNLLKEVPAELVILPPADYAQLVLAKSTIEETVAVWRSRGNVGDMAHLKGSDAATVIRRALVKCPDEYPPVATTELLFINDAELRDNIGAWPQRAPTPSCPTSR